MRCPICDKHLVQEGIAEAIDEYGDPKNDGSIDVQFVCEDGHGGWMNIWLEQETIGNEIPNEEVTRQECPL